ncbi:MAG: hypothetical protein QOF40_356, partial [Actinomycetota bacterium]|nr:hypothetical protein [Actinomycetota bacterium]
MDEPQLDAGRDLVDAGVLGEVRRDPPVVPSDGPVVDPPATRRLEQGMGEEEHEPTAGFEDPGDLVEGGLERVDVLERETQEHRVERAVPTGERVGACFRVTGSAGARVSDCDLRGRRSMPITSTPSAARRRATWPSPHPMSSTRRAPPSLR